MANSPAAALMLRNDDEAELGRWTRSTTVRAGLAKRARIVLLASQGVANTHIAEAAGASVVTVLKWRARYEQAGVGGLLDAGRSGRPRRVDHTQIVSATLDAPPKKYGLTHWSSRLLAKHLGIGNATVARAWREYGIQPWRAGTFKFSTDPQLVAKVTDVVGLYLAPPQNAIVLCVDEKSQIQALDRTAPMLPMRPGQIERRTHDYTRYGTTTLFAALEIATGHVSAAIKPKHRRQEFLAFLRQLERTYPGVELHLVMDNYATHKTPEVRDWLADRPRASPGWSASALTSTSCKELTGMVDLTRDAKGRVRARLLDLVPGRSKKAYADWLAERSTQFRHGVQVAALDPFAGYKSAIDDKLADATAVLDAFHVVKLATQAVDEVRRRVQQATLGHRGRKGDPLYGIQTILRAGAQNLTDRQLGHLAAAIEADEAHQGVYVAWRCAQDLRAAYHCKDLIEGRRRAERVLATFHTCPIPEIARLGRTLRRWKGAFLAYFTTDRSSNGGTEAINGIIELHRRLARGFRNRDNYRLL